MFWPLLRLCLLHQHERVTSWGVSAETSSRSTANISPTLQNKKAGIKNFSLEMVHPRYSRGHHHPLKAAVRQNICLIYEPWFPMEQLNWHELQDVGSTNSGSSTDSLTPVNHGQKKEQHPEICAEGISGYEEMAEDMLENTALMTWWHIKKKKKKNYRWWQKWWGKKMCVLYLSSSSSNMGSGQHKHGDAPWSSAKRVSSFHILVKQL